MNFRLSINRLLCIILAVFTTACQKPEGWAVYYGGAAQPEMFKSYGLVVLDRLYPFDIEELKENDTQVVAYVSLGEVTVHDPWYARAKEGGLLLHENPNWVGSHVVDIRNPLWHEIVMEEVLPPLIARGFEGVMLDTLDSPLVLEHEKAGMHKAAIQLVREIRHTYPQLVIIQNRGYAVLEETAPMLNYVLAESTFTNYDAAQQKYILRNQADQNYALNYLHKVAVIAPGLRILGLEYWDLEDIKMKVQISKKLCKNNMLPFISTRSLTQIRPQEGQKAC